MPLGFWRASGEGPPDYCSGAFSYETKRSRMVKLAIGA